MHQKFMVDAISTAEHGQWSDDHSDESNDNQGTLDDRSDESNDDQGMLSDTVTKYHLYLSITCCCWHQLFSYSYCL